MANFLGHIKRKIDEVLNHDYESEQLVRFLQEGGLSKDSRILDVGCGYGRNMIAIREHLGWAIEGVEVNPHIVEENRKRGLNCRTAEEFQAAADSEDNCATGGYDCMIFSHIIEHFQPEELKVFLDSYFKRLKAGGTVIIATPILWEGFYWDFDHIKMYHPIGINMVFGKQDAQVQYYSDTHLQLEDIWFRRTPYMVHYRRGLYVKTRWSYAYVICNWMYALLWKLSFQRIGKVTGWMGRYRKVE